MRQRRQTPRSCTRKSLISKPKAKASPRTEAAEKEVFSNQADAPACVDCGSIMVRNGACYKCVNCGTTSGCS